MRKAVFAEARPRVYKRDPLTLSHHFARVGTQWLFRNTAVPLAPSLCSVVIELHLSHFSFLISMWYAPVHGT